MEGQKHENERNKKRTSTFGQGELFRYTGRNYRKKGTGYGIKVRPLRKRKGRGNHQ